MSASKTKWVRLGDYIERSMINNSDLKYGAELIEGVNSSGVFCTSKANTIDINLKPYKIVNNGDFVYNPSRLDIGSIAYRTQGMCIVSHLYVVFHLNEIGKKHFIPEFLFLYFKRKEFLRQVTFLNIGSQRPEFNFFQMSDIMVPLPPIEVQRELVDTYKGLEALAEQNEALIEPLSKACEAFMYDCIRKYKFERLENFLDLSEEKNREYNYQIDSLRGVTNEGKFDKSKANVLGLDLSNYRVVYKGDFAYNPARINIGSIALNNETTFIISPMYCVFRIKKEKNDILLSEFLLLWFMRKEFQRSTLFYATGSVRDIFDYNLMCDYKIPLPPIEVQQSIVNLYHCMEEAKKIASEAREKLKVICPALIQKAIHQ